MPELGQLWVWAILLAGDYLVVLSAKGELALVAATPVEYKELARFSAIAGKTLNHPAIADGRIYVRNTVEMLAMIFVSRRIDSAMQ